MRVKAKGNLSGAVSAAKDQEVTVTADQGRALIERGLATEVTPAAPKKPAAERGEKS